MARRKSPSARAPATRSPAKRRPAPPAEERSAEAATIAWMLAAVATLAAQLVALAARLAAWGVPGEEIPPVARILPGWFLLCAVVTGGLCLLLTPLVYRVRRSPPPWPVTVGVIIISLTPLVAVGLLAL